MVNGRWDLLQTSAENPFVIGDAPVVTWVRTDQHVPRYGEGFSRPDVEVLFPLSPTACLHIQPAVPRTRRVMMPATEEVNMAQAAYATEHCFATIRSGALDAVLQPSFGRAILGVNAFSIRHRDYTNTIFDILMNSGHWVEPPRIT
jgi:hypothetical protein